MVFVSLVGIPVFRDSFGVLNTPIGEVGVQSLIGYSQKWENKQNSQELMPVA